MLPISPGLAEWLLTIVPFDKGTFAIGGDSVIFAGVYQQRGMVVSTTVTFVGQFRRSCAKSGLCSLKFWGPIAWKGGTGGGGIGFERKFALAVPTYRLGIIDRWTCVLHQYVSKCT